MRIICPVRRGSRASKLSASASTTPLKVPVVPDTAPLNVPVVPVIAAAVNPAAVKVILPVDVPVAVVVPTANTSADSSQIRAALSPV